MTPPPDRTAPAAENPSTDHLPSPPTVAWADAARGSQFDAWLQRLAGPHALDMASVRPGRGVGVPVMPGVRNSRYRRG